MQWAVGAVGAGAGGGGLIILRERASLMADWRKLAMQAILADGKIDDTEVKILKKEFFADNKIDDSEVKFLLELRETAQKKARARKEEPSASFDAFFFSAL